MYNSNSAEGGCVCTVFFSDDIIKLFKMQIKWFG